MAKLTRDQLEKFNGKCKNGFSLDLFFFCTWGEKRCKKIVKIGDDSIIYDVIVEFYDKAVKEPETAKNWEVSTYYMNGYYNPETKELTTVDAAGNCDIWDNIEILDLYKDADYWKDIDENNEVFVWAKISTNGTKSINDDEAVVFPGNYSVFKDHAKIFILDGEIIVKEK